MRIAFDIDDTLAKFTARLIPLAQTYDRLYSKSKKGVICKNKQIWHGMFDWSTAEKNHFDSIAIPQAHPVLQPVYTGLQLAKTLKKDGDQIYLISARGFDGYSKCSVSTNWLKEQELKYDKLIIKQYDKSFMINKNKIDVYIDNSYKKCVSAEQNCPNTKIYQVSAEQRPFTKYKNYTTYEDLYYEIYKLYNRKTMLERYPIIIDSDVTNEIDDEFALSYLFSFKNAPVEAITIAPHFSDNNKNLVIKDNVKRSYKKAKRLAKLAGREDLVKKIYKGTEALLGLGNPPDSEGVDKIIEICKKHEKVTFIAIGVPTNLAVAVTKAPEIADKIKLYSLMGELTPFGLQSETNMSKDPIATQIVIEKIKDKTIFPASCFAPLYLSAKNLEEELDLQNSELAKLLYKGFTNTLKAFKISYKSLFDCGVIYYLSNPIPFIESEVAVKFVHSHIALNKKGKNRAYIVSQMRDSGRILADMFKRLRALK